MELARSAKGIDEDPRPTDRMLLPLSSCFPFGPPLEGEDGDDYES
jgi:hypothetical protein